MPLMVSSIGVFDAEADASYAEGAEASDIASSGTASSSIVISSMFMSVIVRYLAGFSD